jgi:hypothetical protein
MYTVHQHIPRGGPRTHTVKNATSDSKTGGHYHPVIKELWKALRTSSEDPLDVPYMRMPDLVGSPRWCGGRAFPVVVEPHAVAPAQQDPPGGDLISSGLPRRCIKWNPAGLRQQLSFVHGIGRCRHWGLGYVPDREVSTRDHDGALGPGGEHRARD